MFWKKALALVFASNALLGNLCFIQVVQAMTPSFVGDVAETQSVGKRLPMSSPEASECPWVKMSEGRMKPEESPCASGHCVKEAAPTESCTAVAAVEVLAATLPAAFAAEETPSVSDEVVIPEATEGPPGLDGVTSVVLRE